MRSTFVVVACTIVIVLGLAVSTISSPAGSVIALAGLAGLCAFLVYAWIKAARTDRALYYRPGKARREWEAEQEAARRAEQRKAGRDR